MRAEDKELEGPELAREQRLEAAREAGQDELPETICEEVQEVALDHRSRLFDALRLILAGEQVNLTLLYLPRRETLALEALQTATRGFDSIGEFVFAEDRRQLLEQALAVLQQNLTHGEPGQLAELQSKFASMTAQVGALREELGSLEDAQERVVEFHNATRQEVDDDKDDKDDKDDQSENDDKDLPTPKADAGLVDFIAEALLAMAEVSTTRTSTLAGEERPADTPRPSSLTDGPERALPPKPPSSLYGELPDASPTAAHDPTPQRRKVKQPEPDPEPEPEPKKGTK